MDDCTHIFSVAQVRNPLGMCYGWCMTATTNPPDQKAIDAKVGRNVRLAMNMATPRMSMPAAAVKLGKSRDWVRLRIEGTYPFPYSALVALAFHLGVDVEELTAQ